MSEEAPQDLSESINALGAEINEQRWKKFHDALQEVNQATHPDKDFTGANAALITDLIKLTSPDGTVRKLVPTEEGVMLHVVRPTANDDTQTTAYSYVYESRVLQLPGLLSFTALSQEEEAKYISDNMLTELHGMALAVSITGAQLTVKPDAYSGPIE